MASQQYRQPPLNTSIYLKFGAPPQDTAQGTCRPQLLAPAFLNLSVQSLRPDGGITVSVETITEYGPRYPHRVSFKQLLYSP